MNLWLNSSLCTWKRVFYGIAVQNLYSQECTVHCKKGIYVPCYALQNCVWGLRLAYQHSALCSSLALVQMHQTHELNPQWLQVLGYALCKQTLKKHKHKTDKPEMCASQNKSTKLGYLFRFQLHVVKCIIPLRQKETSVCAAIMRVRCTGGTGLGQILQP